MCPIPAAEYILYAELYVLFALFSYNILLFWNSGTRKQRYDEEHIIHTSTTGIECAITPENERVNYSAIIHYLSACTPTVNIDKDEEFQVGSCLINFKIYFMLFILLCIGLLAFIALFALLVCETA